MNKENVVYTYKEYYSALKKKKSLQYPMKWMIPEDILLSETSQPQKDI